MGLSHTLLVLGIRVHDPVGYAHIKNEIHHPLPFQPPIIGRRYIAQKNPETVLKTFNPDVRQMSHPPAGKAASRRNLQHATDRAGTQAPLHPRQGPPQHQKPAGGWRLWDLDAHSCNLDPIIIQYDLDLVVVHQTTRPRN